MSPGVTADRYCRSCGARLASDNRAALCASCASTAGLLTAPPDVPESFWSVDLVRDALASWHIGRVLSAYRNHPFHGTPISQTTVAGWVGTTQPQISKLETGPPIKDLDRLTFWARTLRVPAELLWFRLRGEPSPSGPDGAVLPAARTVGAGVDEQPGVTDLLAELTVSGLPLLHQPATAPVGVGAIDGLSLQQSADGVLRFFLQLDDQMGGDTLYVPLARYVARLAVNAQRDLGGGLPAFGQLSQMTGWLALDANQHPEARRYLTTAVYVAHEAHEPALAASSLAYMSLQETYRSHRTSALALAETAFATGAGVLTPLLETTLGTRLARAHAGLGDATQCLRSLEQARAAFANAGSDAEPSWVSYVDEIEVFAQEGACYLDLSLTGEAAASLRHAVELLERRAPHRVRDRVHYLSRLAKCHLVEREVEQACVTAEQALTLSRAIGSARVIERLSEFNDALVPYDDNASAHEFRERFALATAAA